MSTSTGKPAAGSTSRHRPRTRYFSATGCVVQYPDRQDVFVGGMLIASFAPEDKAQRNLAIVAVTRSGQVAKYKLAAVLGVSHETVGRVVRRFEREGLESIVKQKSPGRHCVLTPKLTQQLPRLLDEGLTIDRAHQRIRRRVSRAVVGRCHKQWVAAKQQAEAERLQREREESAQLTLEDECVAVTTERKRSVARSAAGPEEGENREKQGADKVQHG